MTCPLRVRSVEDAEDDARLVVLALEHSAYTTLQSGIDLYHLASCITA